MQKLLTLFLETGKQVKLIYDICISNLQEPEEINNIVITQDGTGIYHGCNEENNYTNINRDVNIISSIDRNVINILDLKKDLALDLPDAIEVPDDDLSIQTISHEEGINFE
jgi:hypothetical protein